MITYKILAEVIMIIHLLWIMFMILGFVYNIVGLFNKKLFKNFWIRTLHLLGILYVAGLYVFDKYCPLTILEAKFRQKFDPTFSQPDSFIIFHLEKIIYPKINPIFIIVPTIFIAVFSLFLYIMYPPKFQKLNY